MAAKGIAPGLKRAFSAMYWDSIPSEIWKEERQMAREKQRDVEFFAKGSDIDAEVLSLVSDNAAKAGVGDFITAAQADLRDFVPEGDTGVVLCNPPYGERLLDVKAAEELYKKLHPQEQIDKLVGSFDEFGRIVPAGIDAQGNLIYGHGRILAARQRGDTEFPCIEIEGLSDTQRRAFVHADNLLSQGGTDEEILRAEMQALHAAGFDVAITGFDPDGLQLGEDVTEPLPPPRK